MRPALVLVLGCCLLAPVPSRSADSPAPERVMLDVVVKDRNNVAVPDLRPEEFEVEENGKKRPVEAARFVRPGERQGGTPGPGNLVALVFVGMDPNQRKRANEAVEELLKAGLPANTHVAVFRIGLRLWTVQPFTGDPALVRQAVEKASSPMDQALAAPDADARRAVGEALAAMTSGRPGDPEAASRAEVLGRIIRQGDRLLRQQQLESPLYLLLALAKGLSSAPGRKSVLYFASGLSVPGQIDNVFKATQSEANRARVSFYAVDVGGLDVSSEGQRARSAAEAVARTARQQAQRTSGATSRAEMQLDESTEASTRTSGKQPLRELAEHTGGFAVLDTNDYRKPMARLVSDLGGSYEVTYAPAVAAWDGGFRRTEVKVTRGGARVQHGNGWIATPPDDSGPILAYELPLLEALSAQAPRQDFPIAVGTFAFGSTPEGRELTLVAELPIASFKVSTDSAAGLYRLHFALLALVKDAEGRTVERVSQDYPIEGPLDKLPQLQQGNVVFRRMLVVPPGRHTLEIVAQDRENAATGVYRGPLTVRGAEGLAVSSLVVVRRMEPAPPLVPGALEDPLRGEAMRIVPSIGDPISKATTPKLPVYVVVYPAAGGTPQMSFEFSTDGKPEGRNSVVLPAPDPDGRIRFLASLPLEKYAPGTHDLKVTVRQGAAQAEERVAITLQP